MTDLSLLQRFPDVPVPAQPALVVLLDRDGTLIVERHYLRDPDLVEFVPGAVDALRRLLAADVYVAVVTNQAGVARGYMTIEDVQRVNQRMMDLLRAAGVGIHALVYCPYHPEGTVAPFNCASSLRKPEPGMYELICAHEDLASVPVVAIGDRLSDVGLGYRCGGRGVLVTTGHGDGEVAAVREAYPGAVIAADIGTAVGDVLHLLT